MRFTVDGATGFVQPVVRYRLRRCGRGHVPVGLVAIQGQRFEVIARHAHVRLRLTGRFDLSVRAHGDVRIRARHCRTRRLPWTAEPSVSPPADDHRIADEDLEDGEELELDDIDESGEPIEDDDAPPDDEQP